jgi:hypothetical protein
MRKIIAILHFYMWGAVHSSQFNVFSIRVLPPIRIWWIWEQYSEVLSINFQLGTLSIEWSCPEEPVREYCKAHPNLEKYLRTFLEDNIPF